MIKQTSKNENALLMMMMLVCCVDSVVPSHSVQAGGDGTLMSVYGGVVDSVVPSHSVQAGGDGTLMSIYGGVVDSVVPSHIVQAGGDGTLMSVYGGEGCSADNATYCQGVEPITIEPVECESSNNVEPLTYSASLPPGAAANVSTPAAVRQDVSDDGRRLSADGATLPAMRMVYCGTVSGDALLEQHELGDLARSLSSGGNSSALASNVGISERCGQNVSHDDTTGHPVSVADSVVADSSVPDSSRTAVKVQRRSTTLQDVQSTTSSSNTSRKSASVSKPRRTQSVDGETSVLQRR